jgi:hypothetical protein
MSIGEIGWMLVERLLWASLTLALGFAAALLVSRLSFVAPAAKAWAWRLVLLMSAFVVTFNLGVALQVVKARAESNTVEFVNPLVLSAGAGLAAFWLLPACVLLFGLARSAWETRRMLLELPSMPPPPAAVKGGASYRLMRELSCPVVALCPRPLVAAPEWCWQDTPQARLALAHEAAHLRRWDVAWQMIGSAASALLWFHPLAQWSMRELAFWHECAADAAAIRTIECEHHDYATAIVDIVAGVRDPHIPLAIGLGMQAKQLGRRLEVAVDGDRARPLLGGIVALLIIAPALVPWRAVTAPREPNGDLASPRSLGSVVGGSAERDSGGAAAAVMGG